MKAGISFIFIFIRNGCEWAHKTFPVWYAEQNLMSNDARKKGETFPDFLFIFYLSWLEI